MKPSDAIVAIPIERIERRIFSIRGHNVMLDSDLAELYGVKTYILNQAAKRSIERFPEDFMFQLSGEEWSNLSSQFVSSSLYHGGRRYLPYAFTEQGVAMLSGVLRSRRAVQVNIGIMRAFVKLRQMLASHADLARKLAEMEKKYDGQFQVVFDAIRQLMETPKPPPKTRPVGFIPWEEKKDSENGLLPKGKYRRGLAGAQKQ
ncbi:MAG: ORF6N domain-containing protein [Candidatus Sumerlaeota bacterium]|nr:ORF6N domain-containing protein [Candidatus Sumerlaeota bacterium]